MKTEITDFIEKAMQSSELSDDASSLLNEIIQVHSTISDALIDLGNVSSLRGSMMLEMKAQNTETVKELAQVTGKTLHEPSDFSPYYWMSMHQDVEGSDEKIILTIHGTRWEITKAWADTQTH